MLLRCRDATPLRVLVENVRRRLVASSCTLQYFFTFQFWLITTTKYRYVPSMGAQNRGLIMHFILPSVHGFEAFAPRGSDLPSGGPISTNCSIDEPFHSFFFPPFHKIPADWCQ